MVAQDEQPWTLVQPLRPWQEQALERWREADHRGVVEAATGTGKTYVALAAIELAMAQFGERARVIVAVPSLELARQWRDDLVNALHVPADEITEWHSRTSKTPNEPRRLVLTVMDTARRRVPELMQAWRGEQLNTLLIVDECHHAGSPSNRRLFEMPADWTIGLSATVEREDGSEQAVFGGLGNVCFTYALLDALNDDAVAPIISVNLYVDLTAAEGQEWATLSATIVRLFRELHGRRIAAGVAGARVDIREIRQLAQDGDDVARSLIAVIDQRTRLVRSAENRGRCVEAISAWLSSTSHSALVFHESIAEAEQSHATLRSFGVIAELEHSKLDKATRQSAAEAFRTGQSRAWVVVRAVDEGVDVPDAACAVIVACTGTERQRIQRFGRILRHREGKLAIAISLLVGGTPEEFRVGRRDASILGAERVRHHRWRNGDAIAPLVDPDQPSTYKPGESNSLSVADQLVGQDLQIDSYVDGEFLSPFALDPSVAPQSQYPLHTAAALVGESETWVMNRLPRIRTDVGPDGETWLTRGEIESLFEQAVREKASKSDASQGRRRSRLGPETHRPAAKPSRRRTLTSDVVLGAAAQLLSTDRERIAAYLNVSQRDLERFIRRTPMLAFQLRGVRGDLGTRK